MKDLIVVSNRVLVLIWTKFNEMTSGWGCHCHALLIRCCYFDLFDRVKSNKKIELKFNYFIYLKIE